MPPSVALGHAVVFRHRLVADQAFQRADLAAQALERLSRAMFPAVQTTPGSGPCLNPCSWAEWRNAATLRGRVSR